VWDKVVLVLPAEELHCCAPIAFIEGKDSFIFCLYHYSSATNIAHLYFVSPRERERQVS